MGSSRDEYDKLRAQQRAQVEANRAARAASQANPTTPGAPTVGTPVPGTDLKAAVQPNPLTAIVAPTLSAAPAAVADAPTPIQTPYGTITTTNPQGQARLEAGNALARERVFDRMMSPSGTGQHYSTTSPGTEARLSASAQNYRDLPANASSEQRAFAKQQYADALNEKSVASRVERARRENPQLTEEQKVARYNASLERQGINPQEIGTAQMNAKGGLDVLSIPEEREAKFVANQAAEDMQSYTAAVRHAKRNARGLSGKEKNAAEESVVRAQQAARQFGIQSGLINPKNPKVGMDMDNAERMARANQRLGRDPSSLSGLAQQRIMNTALAPQQAQQEVETPAARELRELAERNSREQALRWEEEQKRRQMAAFGNLYAQY